MEADVTSLKDIIRRAVHDDPLASAVREIQVEPATDEYDDEFLRIGLSLKLPDRDLDAELEALLERIEEAVSAVDDRYASVRFLDAA